MASFAPVRVLWRDEAEFFTEGIPRENHILSITTLSYLSKVRREIEDAACAEHKGSLGLDPLSMEDATLYPEAISADSVAIANTSKSLLDSISNDFGFCIVSSIILKEISYASFCGIRNVLIYTHRDCCFRHFSTDVLRYAKFIDQALNVDQGVNIIILLPLVVSCTLCERDATPADGFESWDFWNVVRSVCRYNPRLSVGLILPKTTTEHTGFSRSRWRSEPVRLIGAPSTTFENDAGVFLGLCGERERFGIDLLRLKDPPWIAIFDDHTSSQSEDNSGRRGRTAPLVTWSRGCQYFSNIQRTQAPREPLEQYAIDYNWCDLPHRTLRTTTEYLRAWNYIEFERDPVKYDLYRLATAKALRDWEEQKKPTSGEDGKVVILVAGAGRGPLASCALHAAAAEQVPVDVWVVERNPDAYATLQRRNAQEWNGVAKVICDDMRHWPGPSRVDTEHGEQHYSVDIVITELIGNFADNGLSPECIDGVSSLLAPWGISIPCSYTSFITPIAAPKLYKHDTLSNLAISAGATSIHELPAATYLQSVDYLSFGKQDIKPVSTPSELPNSEPDRTSSPTSNLMAISIPVWSFYHAGSQKSERKKPLNNSHNSRFAKVLFDIPRRGVCHGLAGFFECLLYPGVELSTNPRTRMAKSPNMLSWFTMFFPFSTPISLADDSKLAVYMWRQTDNRSVWYDWMADASNVHFDESTPAALNVNHTRIHSSYGAAYRI